jgi:acetyl esterase/lipase
MPSFRARLTNAFLRLAVKPVWRPGLEIGEVRARAAKIDARLARGAPPIAVEETDAGGVPATWFGEPALAARGTILYLHGGAWVMHLPGVYRRFATLLSTLTGMRVLLPEYRLAPEHPFPAAIDDCFATYTWLLEQGHADRPLVVAGDSAGGGLTLVTLMRARSAMLRMPDCAVMLSPAADLTFSGPSVRYNADADPMFSIASIDLLADQYCPGQDLGNPRISPLFGSWDGLPPLLFHVGSTEMLLDDSVRAHDRARQAGVDATIEVYRGVPHVFHVFAWLPEARLATRAIGEYITSRTQRTRRDSA